MLLNSAVHEPDSNLKLTFIEQGNNKNQKKQPLPNSQTWKEQPLHRVNSAWKITVTDSFNCPVWLVSFFLNARHWTKIVWLLKFTIIRCLSNLISAVVVAAAVVVVAAAAYVTTYWASSSVRTHLPICPPPPPIPVRIRTFHGTKPWLVTITLSVFEIMRNRIQPSWEYKKYLWWSSTIGSTSFVCLQNDQLLTTEL